MISCTVDTPLGQWAGPYVVHGVLGVGGVSGVAAGLVAVGLWELGAHLLHYDCDWGRACSRHRQDDVEVNREINSS